MTWFTADRSKSFATTRKSVQLSFRPTWSWLVCFLLTDLNALKFILENVNMSIAQVSAIGPNHSPFILQI